MKKKSPSIDEWLKEAKSDPVSKEEGMYLVHNGVVRESPKQKVRNGFDDGTKVVKLEFSYDEEKVNEAVQKAKKMDGIFHIRIWLNEGILDVADDIMYVLVGGDIRPKVIEALQFLVEEVKTKCVKEVETKA